MHRAVLDEDPDFVRQPRLGISPPGTAEDLYCRVEKQSM